MKKINFKNLAFTGLIMIFSGICTAGFSQKKSDASPSKDAIKLQYIYPEGKTFKYVSETKIVQDMDINGQSMLVNIAMSLGCVVKSTGKQGENLKLEVLIDSMSQNVESPQGAAGGSVNDVKGKFFTLIISPSGKTIDNSEASKVVYVLEGSGENNMSEAFLNYFPVLPAGAIKPGDTWVTNDTINTKSASNTTIMPVQTTNKFEGIESVDGVDCAKITAVLSGTRKMTTQSQGMEIHVSGPFTGTSEFLFAVKDGYMVKEAVITKMTGTIEIPDQNMSFPVVMNINSTNTIVK